MGEFTEARARRLVLPSFLLPYLYTDTLTIGFGIRHEPIGSHIDIAPIRLEQLPPSVLPMILLAAKATPDLRVHQEKLRVSQLHPETLPGAL